MLPTRHAHTCVGLLSLALGTAAVSTVAPAYTVDRPPPPEFRFVSDSLFPVMHDPARAPWVLKRLLPILAKYPNHAPFRQLKFWALANTGAPAVVLAALTDSLVGGVSPSGRREPPGRLQQANHCLELGQVLFARRESLTMAESYLRKATDYLGATYAPSYRAAVDDLLKQIGRAREAAAPDTLPFPAPGGAIGPPVPPTATRAWWESNLASSLLGALVAILVVYLAQWKRDRAERKCTTARLVTRIRSALETSAQTLRIVLETKGDGTREIDPQSMHSIVLEWSRYDRVSDDIGLLKDPRLEEQIEHVLVAARMVAETALEDQGRFDREDDEYREWMLGGMALRQTREGVTERQVAQRRVRLKVMEPVAHEAERVLNLLNSLWKPPSWHEPARLAESVDGE